MLEAMAGPHPWDYTVAGGAAAWIMPSQLARRSCVASASPTARTSATRGWTADVAALVEEAVGAFTDMGAAVEEVTPNWGPVGPELFDFFWPHRVLGAAEGAA